MNTQDDQPPGKNGYQLPQTVGIIYSDAKREYFPTEDQWLTEKDAFRDAQIFAGYIKKLGVRPLLYEGKRDLTASLLKDKPDMVINLVGSVKGNEYLAATIPGILEFISVPYTGAGILGESLSYNKFLIKKLLQQNGVPVPNYQLFNSPTDPVAIELRYPLISKLNEIHGAVEITKDSISENEKHLRERLKKLISTYKQPVLVEEFIVGREVTAILFEGLNKKVYLAEKVFPQSDTIDSSYRFASFEDQWLENQISSYHYEKFTDERLKEYVKNAFEITKMSDYGKFDIRMDLSGRYYFIDCNSNPAFGPKESKCAIAYILDLYNVPFTEILKRLILNTMRDASGNELLPIVDSYSYHTKKAAE